MSIDLNPNLLVVLVVAVVGVGAYFYFDSGKGEASPAAASAVQTMDDYCGGSADYAAMFDAKMDLEAKFKAGAISAEDIEAAADELDECDDSTARQLRAVASQ